MLYVFETTFLNHYNVSCFNLLQTKMYRRYQFEIWKVSKVMFIKLWTFDPALVKSKCVSCCHISFQIRFWCYKIFLLKVWIFSWPDIGFEPTKTSVMSLNAHWDQFWPESPQIHICTKSFLIPKTHQAGQCYRGVVWKTTVIFFIVSIT